MAVLLDGAVPLSQTLKYRLTLLAEIGAALHRSDVDLVVLNEAPPVLAHRVLSLGQLVFERSGSARVRFQVRAVNRYLDTKPMRKIFEAYLKRDVRGV